MLRRVGRAFVSNEGLKRYLDGRMDPARVSVVFDYVDLNMFGAHRLDQARVAQLRDRYKANGEKLITFLGMFKDYQGGDYLLKAFARLAPQYPHARLLLVGDGPCRAQYDEIIRDAGIADRVVLPGLVPHRDVVNWLHVSDVVVSPRVDNEITRAGFVSQLPEYMAMNKLTVATAVSGCAYLLRNGAGILVEPNDVEALRSGLERALNLLPRPRPRSLQGLARTWASSPGNRESARYIGFIAHCSCGWTGKMSLRILTVVIGTRPEAIKMAPLIRRLAADARFEPRVCVTGQHRQMLDAALAMFEIRPDFDLNIMRANQQLTDIAAATLTGVAKVIDEFKPDRVLVQATRPRRWRPRLRRFTSTCPSVTSKRGCGQGTCRHPFRRRVIASSPRSSRTCISRRRSGRDRTYWRKVSAIPRYSSPGIP